MKRNKPPNRSEAQVFTLGDDNERSWRWRGLSQTSASRRTRLNGTRRSISRDDLYVEAAALGMGAICVRDDVGGSGMGRLDAALIFEALATGCPAASAFLIHSQHGGDRDRPLCGR